MTDMDAAVLNRFKDAQKAPSWQRFLSVPSTTMEEWAMVLKRVDEYVDKKPEATPELRSVARMLAKYDYFGAPSNWLAVHEHEETIWWWAWWVVHEAKEMHADEIRDGLAEYEAGRIPDFFEMLADYFD